MNYEEFDDHLLRESKKHQEWNRIKRACMSDIDDGIWTTRDYRRLHVSDMSLSHINNTISMLERMIDKYDEDLKTNGYADCQVSKIQKEIDLSYIDMFNNEINRRVSDAHG